MTKDTRTSLGATRLAAHSTVATMSVVSAALLLATPRLLARMGLQELVTTHREVIGLLFLISGAAFLVGQVFPWAARLMVRRFKAWSAFRKGKQRLHDLTRSEKNILNQYVSRDTRSLVLDGRSGATVALQHAGVISRTSDLEDTLTGVTFTISPWARDYLRANRQVLDAQETSPTRLSDWRARQRG